MKHSFIINPAAGNGKAQEALLPMILSAVKQWGADYDIHRTSGPGEATTYASSRLKANPDVKIRFYSCGGDGTTAEILNGLYGHDNAELAIIPAGSGNDYIRNFGEKDKFRDITAQLAGESVPVDVIKYTYTPHKTSGDPDENENEVTAYALNMINMGFDAKAAYHMGRIKNKFFIKGTGAYVAGVVRELASYKMSHVVFHPEGEADLETDILLAGVGSGRFSGGGFEGVPGAIVNDGLLDFIEIEPVSRGDFLRHVGIYHDGKHTTHPFFQPRMKMYRLKSIDIDPATGLVFTVDGEPHYTKKTLKVSIAPEQIRFVLPDGVEKP